MAPPSAGQLAKWNRGFEELGPERVRSALIVSDWDPDKRRAARLWLEHADVTNWQAKRPAESDSGTFFLNLRNAKWWAIVTGGLFLLFAAARLWRRM